MAFCMASISCPLNWQKDLKVKIASDTGFIPVPFSVYQDFASPKPCCLLFLFVCLFILKPLLFSFLNRRIV